MLAMAVILECSLEGGASKNGGVSNADCGITLLEEF
jgi:hypothetical protein